MKIGDLEFSCNKGAFIVGKNSSGKSTIIKRVYSEYDKKKEKIEIDGIKHDLIIIDSEKIIDETTKGTKSLVTNSLDNKIKEINIDSPQPSNLFNDDELNKYKTDLKKSANDKIIENIFGSGIDIIYEPEVKQKDLLDVKMSLTFNNNKYSINEASVGIRCLVGLLLKGLDKNQQNNGQEIGQLILIDEIESFLHPEWISLVAQIINSLIKEGTKVILVTHSPILLARLIKENIDMLSVVEWGDDSKSGKIKTIEYEKVKNKIKKSFEENTNDDEVSVEYVDKYIRATLNQETCMIFFWDKPIIVEGSTEKIYIEQKYSKDVVSANGFFIFPIFAEIISNLGLKAKFLMDNDKKSQLEKYNNFVFELLKKINFDIFRFQGDFDQFLHNNQEKLKPWEKIPKMLKKINVENPSDPNKELVKFEEFILDK